MNISIVIPVFNEPKGIATTLDSLIDQKTELNYEIVVVDNNSGDTTPAVVKSYKDQHPDTIFLHRETNIQSSYAARNTGIKKSNGDLIAFLDADMWVDDDYIQQISTAIERNECYYMGCNVDIVVAGESSIGRWDATNGFPIKMYVEQLHFAPTCCLVAKREVFDEVGLFDSRLISSGDLEFGRRVHQAGYTQCFEPNITLYHPARESIQSLINKHVRIARGYVQLSIYHSWNPNYRQPVWHPQSLPIVNPLGFYRNYVSEADGIDELVVWFFIQWILKFADTYGVLRERLHHHRSKGMI